MKFNFARRASSDIYFYDLDVSIPYSVKFDVLQGDCIIGTLITSNSRSVGKFRDGDLRIRKNQGFLVPQKKYYIKSENDDTLAVVSVSNLLFISNAELTIKYRNGDKYTLSRHYNRRKLGVGYDLEFSFCKNDALVCCIRNYQNGSRGYDKERELEGTIDTFEDFDRDNILDFFFMIQLTLEIHDSSL